MSDSNAEVLASDDDDGHSSRFPDGQLLASSDSDAPPSRPARPITYRKAAAPTHGCIGVWLVHELPYEPACSSSAAPDVSSGAAELKNRVVGFAQLEWDFKPRPAGDDAADPRGQADGRLPRRRGGTDGTWAQVDYTIDEHRLFEQELNGPASDRLDDPAMCLQMTNWLGDIEFPVMGGRFPSLEKMCARAA
jgi:hypothetical protein